MSSPDESIGTPRSRPPPEPHQIHDPVQRNQKSTRIRKRQRPVTASATGGSAASRNNLSRKTARSVSFSMDQETPLSSHKAKNQRASKNLHHRSAAAATRSLQQRTSSPLSRHSSSFQHAQRLSSKNSATLNQHLSSTANAENATPSQHPRKLLKRYSTPQLRRQNRTGKRRATTSKTPPPALRRRRSVPSFSPGKFASGKKSKPFLSSMLSLKSFVLMENLLSEKLKLNQLVCRYEEKHGSSSTSQSQPDAQKLSSADSPSSKQTPTTTDVFSPEKILRNPRNLHTTSDPQSEDEHNFQTASNMTTHLLYILYIVVLLQRVEDIPIQVYCEIYNYMLRGEFWTRNILANEEMQRFIVSFIQKMSFEAFGSIGMAPSQAQQEEAGASSLGDENQPTADSTSTNQSQPKDTFYNTHIMDKLNTHIQNDRIYDEIITQKLDVVLPVVAISFLWIWSKREEDGRNLLKILLDRKKEYPYRIPKREIAWMYYLIGESFVQELYREESAAAASSLSVQQRDTHHLDALRKQALFWFDRSVTLSNEKCWLALTRRAILRLAEEPHAALRDLSKSIALAPYHPENYMHRATLLSTAAPGATDQISVPSKTDMAILAPRAGKPKTGGTHPNPAPTDGVSDETDADDADSADENEMPSIYDLDKAIHDLTAVVLMKGTYLYDALNQRAKLLLLKDKRKAALRDLTMAIQKFPKKSIAYYNRALIIKEKSPQQSIIDLTIALSILPKPEYYFQRAAASVQLGRYSDALSDYTASIRISKSPSALFKRSNLLEKLKKYDFALKDLSEAIKLDGTQSKYFARRALIYFKNKRSYKLALRDFDESIARDKINPQHYNNRGLVLMALKQFDRAMQDFNSAIDLNMEYAAAYMNRARIHIRMDHFQLALRDMEAACLHDPANDYYRFSKSGLYSYNNRVEQHDPKNKRIFMYSKNSALKDISDAIRISESKNQPKAQYYARRAAFLKYDDLDCCVEDLTKAITLSESSNTKESHGKKTSPIQNSRANSTTADYLAQRAQVYESKSLFSDALRDFSRAIQLNPNNKSYYIHRAALYMKKGQEIPEVKEAWELFRKEQSEKKEEGSASVDDKQTDVVAPTFEKYVGQLAKRDAMKVRSLSAASKQSKSKQT